MKTSNWLLKTENCFYALIATTSAVITKFAMFFMAEYANMITVACIASLLFLGGWHGPLFGPPILQAILPVFWFVLRVVAFLFVYIWVRGTLPRFRYDQLMAFGWKFLLPLAIANLVVTALVVALRA